MLADRQTDTVITILRLPTGSEVHKLIDRVCNELVHYSVDCTADSQSNNNAQ